MAKPILPASYVNFMDGQLPKGPVPSGIFVFVGVGDGSATNLAVTPVNSPNSIVSLFGIGPLARDLTAFFLSGAGFCYAIQVPSSAVGSIGAPVVGGFTGLSITGTVKNSYRIVGRLLVPGDVSVAQYEISLDGGRTFGPAQVLKATLNKIIGPDGLDTGLVFSVTKTEDYLIGDANFTCTTVAPKASDAELFAASDVAIQTAGLFFNAFHFSQDFADLSAAISFYSSVQTKLDVAAETWSKFLAAICQAPSSAVATGSAALAFAQGLRAGFGGKRVMVAGQVAVIKTQGGQHTMSISSVLAARRSQLEPQNELGLVRAGQLTAVVDWAAGWGMSDIMGIDPIKNVATIRTHVGAAGFFPTFGRMTDPTSDYSLDCRRYVADLVATDSQVAGLSFLHLDVDPDSPEDSAQPLLDAVRGPARERIRRKQASRIEFSIPEGQDILTSEELVVEIGIVPMGHASWIRFNLGFKSPFAGA